MDLSSQTKVLLLVAGVLILILFSCGCSSSDPIHNQGTLSYEEDKQERNAIIAEQPPNINQPDDLLPSEMLTEPQSEADAVIRSRFRSKNKAKPGQFKVANYAEGVRGNDSNSPNNFDVFFDTNNELVAGSHRENDGFSGNDEGGNLAAYKPGKRRQQSDEDIFNSMDFLPQQKNKDWFEVMPEPISIKNRYLINVSRPIGVDTIGTTHRNQSYDIRGTIPNPKQVVSPWLQSSIEPDLYNKGLC